MSMDIRNARQLQYKKANSNELKPELNTGSKVANMSKMKIKKVNAFLKKVLLVISRQEEKCFKTNKIDVKKENVKKTSKKNIVFCISFFSDDYQKKNK